MTQRKLLSVSRLQNRSCGVVATGKLVDCSGGQVRATKQTFFNPKRGEVFVKNGFSWPAFFFSGLWAIANHMWFPYVLLMLPFDILVWFVANVAQEQNNAKLALLALAATVAYAVVRGRFGNRWMAASLQRRGYVERAADPHAAKSP